MNACDVTARDMRQAEREGLCFAEAADKYGVSRPSMTRLARRYGVKLRQGKADLAGFEAIKEQADDLPLAESREFLLFMVERLLPTNGDVGTWPGIRLTPRQRAIFAAIYARGGRVVTRDTLIAAIYPNPADEPSAAWWNVRNNLSALRKQIAGTGARIEAVYGEGYRFVREPGAVFPWEKHNGAS